MQEILRNAGVPIVYPEPGQVLDLGSGAALEILAVTRRGAVLRLSWGALQMLLPIGVDFEALEADYGSANILMLAESGFAPLNPPEWIAAGVGGDFKSHGRGGYHNPGEPGGGGGGEDKIKTGRGFSLLTKPLIPIKIQI
ncbi:MAG TPA: hypothetical protein VMN57_10705 [Anaerolineales bacterium]|nr:hypothetical protein [Anaerolineales bacterium]